jgi:3-dehydroquinate synthase
MGANYGHTVGQALEAATGFRRWAHGEAVSLGIAAAARLAERLGIGSSAVTKRQLSLLAAVGLPVAGIQVEPTTVVEALSRDKKSRDGRLPFVFAPEIGSFRLLSDVPREAARSSEGSGLDRYLPPQESCVRDSGAPPGGRA